MRRLIEHDLLAGTAGMGDDLVADLEAYLAKVVALDLWVAARDALLTTGGNTLQT